MGETAKPRAPARRSADAQFASLEEVVGGLRDDILAVRRAAVDGLKQLDNRVHLLEDVRVRALEDWRLSQKVLQTERERVAREEAEDVTETKREHLTRRQFWIGQAATVVVSTAGALTATGHLF